MKSLFIKLGKKALNGIIPGLFFALTVASVTYALTYNWSDPSGIRGRTAGNPLSASGWNLLVGNVDNLNERLAAVEWTNGVPAWAVMSFYLATCPTGWRAANGTSSTPDLRGEFVRGLDGGRWIDTSRTLWSWQDATGVGMYVYQWAYNLFKNQDSTESTAVSTSRGGVAGYTDNQIYYKVRPRNVALLYCVKN